MPLAAERMGPAALLPARLVLSLLQVGLCPCSDPFHNSLCILMEEQTEDREQSPDCGHCPSCLTRGSFLSPQKSNTITSGYTLLARSYALHPSIVLLSFTTAVVFYKIAAFTLQYMSFTCMKITIPWVVQPGKDPSVKHKLPLLFLRNSSSFLC